jgi:hypothetical protein
MERSKTAKVAKRLKMVELKTKKNAER